jgi:hypothetical protein
VIAAKGGRACFIASAGAKVEAKDSWECGLVLSSYERADGGPRSSVGGSGRGQITKWNGSVGQALGRRESQRQRANGSQ